MQFLRTGLIQVVSGKLLPRLRAKFNSRTKSSTVLTCSLVSTLPKIILAAPWSVEERSPLANFYPCRSMTRHPIMYSLGGEWSSCGATPSLSRFPRGNPFSKRAAHTRGNGW